MCLSPVSSPSRHRLVREDTPVVWYVRVLLIISICAMQAIVFYGTYRLYDIISYTSFLELETWLDHIVPYIGWSWIVYYFGFVYIAVWGGAGIWRMSRLELWATTRIYIGLVLIGGILHLIIPSDSPWPDVASLSEAQRAFKSSLDVEPLAGFPSMHAALATLPAYISIYTLKSRLQQYLSVLLAALVCISVVTAKEHWAIDVPAGIVMGLVAGWLWKRSIRRAANVPVIVAANKTATDQLIR